MPYTTSIDCPACDRPLIRKPGGCCPHCGERITEHVARTRLREKRIEQVVAVLSTAAVLALFILTGGLGLLEGVAVYAAAGVTVWYWGKGTFWSATLYEDGSEDGSEIIDDDAP